MFKIQFVIDFWKQRKVRLICLIFFTALGTGISLSFPYIFKLLIDGITAHLAPEKILKYVLLLLCLGALRAVVSTYLPFFRGITNELFAWRTRNSVFKRLLVRDHNATQRFPPGDVIARVDQDLTDLSWFACSGIFRPVEATFVIVTALIILIKINPFLTMVSFIPVASIVFVWLRFGSAVYKRYLKWREKISETHNHLSASFSGIKLIKSYTMEEQSVKRLRQILDERIVRAISTVKVESKIGVFYSGISELGTLIVLWVGGILVIKHALTLGEFVAFNSYILMLIGPMTDIGNFFVLGKRSQGGAKRIREICEHKTDEKLVAENAEISDWKDITISNVSFSYKKDEKDLSRDGYVLQDINMKITPGSKIGIAGTVGSGKSTLIQTLLRITNPGEGEIRINGVDIREVSLDKLRALFGYVPQELNLFSDTIYNNIVLGRDVESKESVERMAEIAQLGFKEFPKGLEEKIGEWGLKLSGGEKQRVAIARALVGTPKILILDDATSSLDVETEQRLIKELFMHTKDMTLIIVSHRLSTLSICDIVYVLDKGKVVETGTHSELLDKQSLYWKLYRHQLMEEELTKV
ncbi:MAG: ABC transporter ATP-binding protein [bacterium]|nr:ABC transporter ATP-binding protein [bacterium]